MHRWVRYHAPVMVCVDIDDDAGQRVISVVIADEADDGRLARDDGGRPLVYDEHMRLLDPADAASSRAVAEAEDRDWPDPDEWDAGPDALRVPGLYDPVDVDVDDEDVDDDLDPLDLDGRHPAQAL